MRRVSLGGREEREEIYKVLLEGRLQINVEERFYTEGYEELKLKRQDETVQ